MVAAAKGDLTNLIDPKLARILRSTRRGEPATLSYIASGLDGRKRSDGRRQTRGGRFADGEAWSLAAWAEIADREPTFSYRRTANSPGSDWVETKPWRAGSESAWAYLKLMAADLAWGGPARQKIADLKRRGILPPED